MLLRAEKRSGLSLIEILIAIIILTVGIVSILSIFPSSIKTASLSVDDTVAAKIAESVIDALNIAMRSATAENITGNVPGRAFFVHDGVSGGSYEFALPLPATPPPGPNGQRFFAHPAKDVADALNITSPRRKPATTFKLGKQAGFIQDVLQDIRKVSDLTDPYDQYKFTFTIKRMDDERATGDPTPPLFQFAVAVYRFQDDDTRYADELPPPIHVFIVMIGGK
ncbi:MAG: hypothetical protein HZA49_10345 [Planctomycetes bacterium]|nr:hypothetical protein [Planctomycetota bacterium]